MSQGAPKTQRPGKAAGAVGFYTSGKSTLLYSFIAFEINKPKRLVCVLAVAGCFCA